MAMSKDDLQTASEMNVDSVDADVAMSTEDEEICEQPALTPEQLVIFIYCK